MGEYSDYVFASDFGFVKLKGETAEKIKVPDSLTRNGLTAFSGEAFSAK